MSIAPDRDKADLEAICQAVAEGKKVDPEITHRVRDRSQELRQKLEHELSVELVRLSREE